MEKKFYNKPIVEQAECAMFASSLCSSDIPSGTPGGGERPGGGGTSAPRRRVF